MDDRRWRQTVERLQRTGLRYVSRNRLPSPDVSTPMAESLQREPVVTNDALPTEMRSAPSEMPNHPAAKVPQVPPAGGDQLFADADSILARPAPADKHQQLINLREEVVRCQRCTVLCENRTQTVFADGSPDAELCFVGEAPGADEDQQGVPFVGKAGQLLTKIIEACKLRRDEVYICNTLKCRPPGNRNPSPDEVANCRDFFNRQLELVRPKMLVALGKFAAASLLDLPPERCPITRLRGQIRSYRGIPLMITLHPAYLLRNPAAKRDVWNDMKTVMRQLGRPVD